MTDDPFEQLEQSKQSVGGSGDYAPWWNDDNFGVEDGDEVVGIVVEKHEYTDPGGDAHPVATVRSVGRGSLDEGTEVSTPTRKGIEPFAEDAEIGDLVFIEYTGEIQANSGRDMHTYEASRMSQDEWAQTGQSDDIQSVWEESGHYSGGSEVAETDDSDDFDAAVNFATDVLKMNDGSVSREEFDEYLLEIKDFDVDVDEVIDEAGLEEDDGEVVES